MADLFTQEMIPNEVMTSSGVKDVKVPLKLIKTCCTVQEAFTLKRFTIWVWTRMLRNTWPGSQVELAGGRIVSFRFHSLSLHWVQYKKTGAMALILDSDWLETVSRVCCGTLLTPMGWSLDPHVARPEEMRNCSHPEIGGAKTLQLCIGGCLEALDRVITAMKNSKNGPEAKHILQFFGKGANKCWHAYLATVEEFEE